MRVFNNLAYALTLEFFLTTTNVMAEQIKAGSYVDSAGRNVTVSQDFDGIVLETGVRPGTKHYHMQFYPKMPTHHQILFVGGDGSYKLEGKKLLKKFNVGPSFLARTRLDYLESGASVTLFGAPSDRYSDKWLYKSGSKPSYRTSEDFLQDLSSLVRELKSKFNVPIWLNGTSAGSHAAVFAAYKLPHLIDGVVISSVPTKAADVMPHDITDIGLVELQQPLLVMMHKDDKCKLTKPSDAKAAFAKATSPNKKFALVEGGGKPKSSKPCKFYAKHGFYKSEADAVAVTMEFIRSNL